MALWLWLGCYGARRLTVDGWVWRCWGLAVVAVDGVGRVGVGSVVPVEVLGVVLVDVVEVNA